MAKQKGTNKSLLKPNVWWLLAILVLTLAVILGLQAAGITHFFSKSKPVTGISSDKNPFSLPGGSGGNSQTTPKQSGGTALQDPSGDFVSNHKPNLSGSPAPAQEQSVCNDVPGAICTISFSKDGVTKSLSPKQIDNSGAAYWTWRLQDIGLAQGSWQISAKATLNNEVKTSNDSLTLEVGQ